MTSKAFRAEVARRVGVKVSDNQVRHAIHVGDLQDVPKRGGWYFFAAEHVDQMASYLRNRSRKLAEAAQ